MMNLLFLEVYTTAQEYKNLQTVEAPLLTYVTYFIFKYCSPSHITLRFVSVDKNEKQAHSSLALRDQGFKFPEVGELPWQVLSCAYPVVMYEDTIITGLCAVARHICRFKTVPRNAKEHEEGLLGFRKSCLQAPNGISIWTKFCEVDIMRTVSAVLDSKKIEVPKNLVRFENHLRKPVKVHNVFKLARDLKKQNTKSDDTKSVQKDLTSSNLVEEKVRSTAKNRKWKSNKKKEVSNCAIGIEDLEISHQFAEGPFFTLADLILLPSYHIIIQRFGASLKCLLPLTERWYRHLLRIPEIETLTYIITIDNQLLIQDVVLPATEDVSLYNCDPKRHNPKKRIYTKEVDIENALSYVTKGMELEISENKYHSSINWNEIPDGASPRAGHLPKERVLRKSQQLENLVLTVLNIAKEGDLIVDFCSGSGHLGILIAHLLPKCTVILLENKEQSLLRARQRVHEMGLKNVLLFQCNLDFFIGKFDIGIALHACGIATDLILDKCLIANAKFVLCPCCYGSLHSTDRLVYPRSTKFSSISTDKYLCIGHASDQTHKEHPLTARGERCMAAIDSDRANLAEEFKYKVTLTRLKPLTCTPKNNLLIGLPSR